MRLIIENKVTRKQAIKFTGINKAECLEFMKDSSDCGHIQFPVIKTLEGYMTISKDDYIIKGLNGEFYPCKPDIFEKSYNIVEMTEGFLD